ncbi:MAG TPA: glucose 1-dehydrogenase, partial [Gammaproteobacteria bacterium]|nr:glucose 1-dehydrogenase [Gammaproteobacteria bacterium]
ILFTGASASMRGRANFGAFNSSKAALRNFAQAMAKECGPEGIHVGHVVVDGPIGGDKIIQGFPQYAEKLGDAGMISIEGIVDGFAYLYHQP